MKKDKEITSMIMYLKNQKQNRKNPGAKGAKVLLICFMKKIKKLYSFSLAFKLGIVVFIKTYRV